jgi:hypothetical protein
MEVDDAELGPILPSTAWVVFLRLGAWVRPHAALCLAVTSVNLGVEEK